MDLEDQITKLWKKMWQELILEAHPPPPQEPMKIIQEAPAPVKALHTLKEYMSLLEIWDLQKLSLFQTCNVYRLEKTP